MLVTVLSESYRTATGTGNPGVSHPLPSGTARQGGWRHHKRPGALGRAVEACLALAFVTLTLLSLGG